MAEILQKQVKPTLSVFFVGDVNAVVDILLASLATVANIFSSSSTIAFIAIQLMAILIQYLKSVNHALIYNGIFKNR